ncbi:MAG: MBL fold metallo-hydrolase [Candidatus Nanoarchaeia archaeon]|nr:MBL fold metallo-hydrolase [Candidatus Nanoarchaeia archaeon]MDD5741363.1 MBL fold metallo-hydrolase [Candidatus Nanoarchaeia archaeon]
MVKITAHGAAQRVAGRKDILEAAGKKIGLDCGYGYDNVRTFPEGYDPQSLDCIVLGHPHVDHIGMLSDAFVAGFRKPVYCTWATADTSKNQIQQEIYSTMMHNKRVDDLKARGLGKDLEYEKQRYTYQDFKKIMELFVPFETFEGEKVQRGFPYLEPIKISNNITAYLYDAGHSTGSAEVLFEIIESGKMVKILSSCDRGRNDIDMPILRKPNTRFPKDIDAVLMECTYGDKTHEPIENSIGALEKAVWDTYQKNGKLIMPAFAITRTAIAKVLLYRMFKEGRFPKGMLIHSSSPGADKDGRIILKYPQYLDERAIKEFEKKYDCPFKFEILVRHIKLQDLKNYLEAGVASNPSIILASSGMCQDGRIDRILRHEIEDDKNTITLLGFQAPGTRGYLLDQARISGEKIMVPFYDKAVRLGAEVRKIGGFSCHPDIIEAIAHVNNLYNPKKDFGKRKPLKILLEHGEKENCERARKKYIEAGHKPENVIVMEEGKTYEIAA